MIEFQSLVDALSVDGNITKSLAELPPRMRRHVKEASVLAGWDGLPVRWRWQIAEQWDAKNRPRTLAEDNESQRHFRAGYDDIPAESVRLPAMWTVPMCCTWIATRDFELVEYVWLDDEGEDSAHWLNSSRSRLNTYDSEVLVGQSRRLVQSGHEPLPSAGASLACLQEQAAKGNIVVRGQRRGEGDAERISADAWANLHIVPSAHGYQAQPQRQQYSSPWWSGLRVPQDEVRKVWPDVPLPGSVAVTDAEPSATADTSGNQLARAVGAETLELGEDQIPAGQAADDLREGRAVLWLTGEMLARKSRGEIHNRDTMELLGKEKFPDLSRRTLRRLIENLHPDVRAKGGRKGARSKSARKGKPGPT